MKQTTKKEIIYVALAFTTAIGGLPWVQIAYNDPGTFTGMTRESLGVLCSISLIYVIAQALIAWKAYLSDPNPKPQEPKEPKP